MKTRSIYRKRNLHFYDEDYSRARPADGTGMWETCPQLGALDPSLAHTFYDDFYDFQINNSNQLGWISTETEGGAGDAALVIADAAGGVLQITNDDADDDSVELQWHAECFKLSTSKPCWFEARLKVNDATQSDLIVGLCITDTTLIDGMSDGVYFRKDDGDANIDFVTEKNSTETSTDTTVDLADDTYVALGFHFDGAGNVYAYVNGVLKATHTTNIVDDEELAVSIAWQNGTNAAKVLSVDYVKVVQVR